MTTEVLGVNPIAIIHRWSKKRAPPCFLNTFGNTCASSELYEAKFEGEFFGETLSKKIMRPDIIHFAMQFMPLTDTQNKLRQYHLALEKEWPTKDCWFRLFTALTGIAVVDLYKMCCVHDEKHKSMTVKNFADLVTAGSLTQRNRPPAKALRAEKNSMVLKRIVDDDGCSTKPVSKEQKTGAHSRATAGSGKQNTCWICRLCRKDHKHTT